MTWSLSLSFFPSWSLLCLVWKQWVFEEPLQVLIMFITGLGQQDLIVAITDSQTGRGLTITEDLFLRKNKILTWSTSFLCFSWNISIEVWTYRFIIIPLLRSKLCIAVFDLDSTWTPTSIQTLGTNSDLMILGIFKQLIATFFYLKK